MKYHFINQLCVTAVSWRRWQLDLPVNVYNWLANFSHGHSHCMRFNGHTSHLLDVHASIFQVRDLLSARSCMSSMQLTCKLCRWETLW